MLTVEPLSSRNARHAAKCVLCGALLDPPDRGAAGDELREFCASCVEHHFADDALELWSWFCGPAENAPV